MVLVAQRLEGGPVSSNYIHVIIRRISKSVLCCRLIKLIYINDLMECCDVSYIYVFADDAKVYRHIQCPDDCKLLQYTLADLQSWSQKWLLSLNTKKFAV